MSIIHYYYNIISNTFDLNKTTYAIKLYIIIQKIEINNEKMFVYIKYYKI